MIQENVRRKIEALISRAERLASVHMMQRDERHYAACESLFTETLNAMELAIPLRTHPYSQKIKSIARPTAGVANSPQHLHNAGAVLQSMLSDIDAGLIADFGNAIRAETFDDFLDHAEAYQKEGQKPAAGVLAGVVFEDTVRRICRDKGISENGRNLEDLINDLARQGVISSLQSKQARVAAHFRTKATHAQWDEFDLDGVSNTVQTTRRLLQDHLDA